MIPPRAPVEKERIETELRTASGVSDSKGKFIAGVVLITAGYSAEGKYSHFFVTQVPLEIGGVAFKPGDYVFGSKRLDDATMEIKFYEAATGKFLVAVKAAIDPKKGPIHSLLIAPPENGKGTIKVGRFVFNYNLAG